MIILKFGNENPHLLEIEDVDDAKLFMETNSYLNCEAWMLDGTIMEL